MKKIIDFFLSIHLRKQKNEWNRNRVRTIFGCLNQTEDQTKKNFKMPFVYPIAHWRHHLLIFFGFHMEEKKQAICFHLTFYLKRNDIFFYSFVGTFFNSLNLTTKNKERNENKKHILRFKWNKEYKKCYNNHYLLWGEKLNEK